MSVPFYLKGKGKKIITKNEINSFIKKNPELKKWFVDFNSDVKVLQVDILTAYCNWIIGQQLSVKVADTITNRFLTKINPLTIDNLLSTKKEELRSLGLSNSKSEYVKNFAKFLKENSEHNIVKSPHNYSSDELREFFMQVKGVGPWTVNMNLIFMLGKKDVLAIKDLVVRKGIQKLYNEPEIPSEKKCIELTKSWGNLATVGTMLAWHVAE